MQPPKGILVADPVLRQGGWAVVALFADQLIGIPSASCGPLSVLAGTPVPACGRASGAKVPIVYAVRRYGGGTSGGALIAGAGGVSTTVSTTGPRPVSAAACSSGVDAAGRATAGTDASAWTPRDASELPVPSTASVRANITTRRMRIVDRGDGVRFTSSRRRGAAARCDWAATRSAGRDPSDRPARCSSVSGTLTAHKPTARRGGDVILAYTKKVLRPLKPVLGPIWKPLRPMIEKPPPPAGEQSERSPQGARLEGRAGERRAHPADHQAGVRRAYGACPLLPGALVVHVRGGGAHRGPDPAPPSDDRPRAGAHLRPVIVGADVMALSHLEDLEAEGQEIIHDATVAPWPVADKAYDLFVALQVFEHLGDEQPQTFAEVRRVAKHAILSLPIDWEMPDPTNCHHMLRTRRSCPGSPRSSRPGSSSAMAATRSASSTCSRTCPPDGRVETPAEPPAGVSKRRAGRSGGPALPVEVPVRSPRDCRPRTASRVEQVRRRGSGPVGVHQELRLSGAHARCAVPWSVGPVSTTGPVPSARTTETPCSDRSLPLCQ